MQLNAIKSSEITATFRIKTENICLFSAVLGSSYEFYLSQLMITSKDFVCCSTELDFLKDIGAIEVLQLVVVFIMLPFYVDFY